MKPIITLDLDNTVLDTGKGSAPPEKRTYAEFQQRFKGILPGAEKLCALYRVYFLSARSFPGAYELSSSQTWELPCMGLLTGVEHLYKEQVSKALGAIAHVDDDWRVARTIHTLLVNPWEECPEHLKAGAYTGLDDPALIYVIESRREP